MSIKVSVIIPVYNVEKYLSVCLESVLNQSLKDIEIICINDGSKDNSRKILEKYQVLDSRIIIIDKSNGGYGAACNCGLRLASGKYTAIVESDDFIDIEMLKDLYNMAESNGADIVKSAYYEYRDGIEENSSLKINWSNDYKMPENIFRIKDCPQFLYFHPSIWSCLYKTEFLKQNGICFVEAKGAGWADNPFQVKTLCRADKILYTDNAYYHYRITNPESSSTVVNINNPFDRSDEIHMFLDENSINDENLLAHLYKREFSYIDIVLACITPDLVNYAYDKIFALIRRMNEKIVNNNKYINDYEKRAYRECKTKEGLIRKMHEVKSRPDNIAQRAVVN